jgi:hypothetical protein
MEQLGTYSNVGTLVMLVALVTYKFLKHSSCRSKCFGQENSLKVDLSETRSSGDSLSAKLDEKFNISPPSPESPRPTIFV